MKNFVSVLAPSAFSIAPTLASQEHTWPPSALLATCSDDKGFKSCSDDKETCTDDKETCGDDDKGTCSDDKGFKSYCSETHDRT
jgi:hypothetical protein